MTVLSRKICLLGGFAVGKTSTVARSVRNTFSETYLTTIGVKVDSKDMALDSDMRLRLVLWDIAGANEFEQLNVSYLVGAQGLLLVADGTREHTVDVALNLRERANQLLGRDLPSVLILNKADLVGEWGLSQPRLRELQALLPVFAASAKTGDGVEASFDALARAVTS